MQRKGPKGGVQGPPTNSLLPTRRSEGRKTGLCFATFVFLTFRGPLASHDSNLYPNRSRIARYNATKFGVKAPPKKKSLQCSAEKWGLLLTQSALFWSEWGLCPVGGGGYMREMGAICQIGVLTWKPCTFWVQNGCIFGLFALRFQ